MRSDIRSSASDIITQAEWTGHSDSPALAGGLNLLSWGQHFHWADPCLPLGHRSPPLPPRLAGALAQSPGASGTRGAAEK